MGKLFDNNDRTTFQETLDKISGMGEKLGALFNKKTTWLIKSFVIFLSLVFFGFIFFGASFLRHALNRKK